MNTPNTVMLKIGVWLQTMTFPVYVYTGPTLPDAFSRLLKKIQTSSPFEMLNKERLSMGYAPLTNSEWLAEKNAELAQALQNDEDDDWLETHAPAFSHRLGNVWHDMDND